MTDDSAEGGYDLAMPFVLCQSNGGPFDDTAFVAGATCGALTEELAALARSGATPRERYLDACLLPQVDLIAMAHGYKITPGELDDASGWQAVSFEPADA